MRTTRDPNSEVTQTAPSVKATDEGPPGTGIVVSVPRVVVSRRETVSSSTLATQSEPPP